MTHSCARVRPDTVASRHSPASTEAPKVRTALARSQTLCISRPDWAELQLNCAGTNPASWLESACSKALQEPSLKHVFESVFGCSCVDACHRPCCVETLGIPCAVQPADDAAASQRSAR